MATLAERIAAKRAASADPTEPKTQTFAEKLAAKRTAEAPTESAEDPKARAPSPLASEEQAEEQAPPKTPLTFAEKLALKKAAIASVGATPMAAAQAKSVREFSIDPERLPEDNEIAQALTDISKRIFDLEELIDEDLSRSMSELKGALRDNPAASALLLDEDVGKMVSSLRRMRHLSVVAVATKKAGAKTKPKAKDVALTPEQLAQAWDEL